MDWITIQIILLSFGIGIMAGSLFSYCLMRRSLNRNIKTLSNHFKSLTIQKEARQKELDARRDNLYLLADKLKQIENNIQRIRQKELHGYISNLNRLLEQTGISQINEKD